jgi:DNA-binding IclR family transcriptional regulator
MLFSDPIRAERIAAMKLLVDQIGETCNFNILDGNEVVYIDRIETNAPIRLHISAGMRVPLHCTASGKLFLSQMSPAQIERLKTKAMPLINANTWMAPFASPFQCSIAKIKCSQRLRHTAQHHGFPLKLQNHLFRT